MYLSRKFTHTFIAISLLAFPTLAESITPQIITRDVCIIGGGSSGTYAAVYLQDRGRTVAVVERQARLGGHTNTYTDPATGLKYDYGVQVWHDTNLVHKYFGRLGVELTKLNASSEIPVSLYANLATGKKAEPVNTGNMTEALGRYAAQLEKYPYLEKGFYLPNPVPDDLLLPFGDFVKKYKLEGMVPFLFDFGQGLGDLLKMQVIYVMKNFGSDVLRLAQSNGFLTTVKHDNSELYDKAAAVLGSDVYYNSHVTSAKRTDDGVEITVNDKLIIRAKKLLVTIPPKISNMKPFSLDETECSLFEKFQNNGYWSFLLRNSGIPDNTSVTNVDPSAPYGVPRTRGFIYAFEPTTIPGLQNVLYGSVDGSQSDTQVKSDILAALENLQAAGVTPKRKTSEKLEFVGTQLSSHTPFELRVSTSDIRDGFYKNLYGLQGHRSTYYTGAAFHTHDSSLIWEFTEGVLAKITA